uniref:DnaJ homolog subfamily A member 3, mitochondrial n=1 Tax=Phallusia mammillata TaxID=59560 RepID=A0A6F9DBT0_9ASCI|nr:dnaJ homolog subfamily A member 3, mitochondrial [Phallusia mammillata]
MLRTCYVWKHINSFSCLQNIAVKRYIYTSMSSKQKDYYDVLGVNRNATQKDIKSAYFKLAKKYHPDSNPGNTEAAEKFRKVTEAYETLRKDNSREHYNTYGHNRQTNNHWQGNPFHNQQWTHQEINMKDAEELFRRFAKNFEGQGFQKTNSSNKRGGIFGSLFSNMMLGLGKNMFEEIAKSSAKGKIDIELNGEKMEIRKGPNGWEFVKKNKK